VKLEKAEEADAAADEIGELTEDEDEGPPVWLDVMLVVGGDEVLVTEDDAVVEGARLLVLDAVGPVENVGSNEVKTMLPPGAPVTQMILLNTLASERIDVRVGEPPQ
jgi:hypothetical protein